MFGVLERRRLDGFTYALIRAGLYAARHSYSYRIFYRDKIIAGIHFYPGYGEVELRLYTVHGDYARKMEPVIGSILRKFFPDYRLDIKWLKPVIAP